MEACIPDRSSTDNVPPGNAVLSSTENRPDTSILDEFGCDPKIDFFKTIKIRDDSCSWFRVQTMAHPHEQMAQMRKSYADRVSSLREQMNALKAGRVDTVSFEKSDLSNIIPLLQVCMKLYNP